MGDPLLTVSGTSEEHLKAAYAGLTEANLELLEGLYWLSTEGLDTHEDYKKVNRRPPTLVYAGSRFANVTDHGH